MIKYFVKNWISVGSGVTIDLDVGSNGGILLSLRLYNSPGQYFDIGTDIESVKSGNIHVLVANSSNNKSLIGQLDTSTDSDVIVVGLGSEWSWIHPSAHGLRHSQIISKLRPNSAFLFQPDGVISSGGQLRIFASWDPVAQIAHNLTIEAEVLVFE